MKKQYVYVVMTGEPHEPNSVVCAFADKGDADAFAEQCRIYSLKRKPLPPIEETEENDRLWERWTKSDERWCRRHPAGYDNSYTNHFDVTKIEFKP